jgi:heptosyltransferase-2
MDEIFEICHMKFAGEEYLIRRDGPKEARWREEVSRRTAGRTVVGLNTGCGKRWTTRLWPEESWMELIGGLRKAGYYPVLLGGPDEDAQNQVYARTTAAWYPGHFPLAEFIALCASLDVVVTQVSMMMHIAIAMKSKLVLMNNIFNRHEFELYGRGEILEPTTGCDCYYGTSCSRQRHCMRDLSPAAVLSAIGRLAPRPTR